MQIFLINVDIFSSRYLLPGSVTISTLNPFYLTVDSNDKSFLTFDLKLFSRSAIKDKISNEAHFHFYFYLT